MDKVSVEASSASHLKENLHIVPICSNIVFNCHKLFDLNLPFVFKGTGHFFEILSVDSVPGTDHS